MSEGDKLATALATLGRDPRAREAIVDALRELELAAPQSAALREEVTGPLVDALFAGAGRVRKTLSSGLILEFVHSSKITRDFILSRPAMPDHVWEPQTTRLLLHLARGTRHVVIGGAYFGDHALLIARSLQASSGTVHAFEPNARNVELLAHNARLNGLANVRAHRKGLWDHAARLRLAGDDALASSVDAAQEGSGDTFDTVTIDDYRRELDGPVGLVMLDIEGGELKALRGGRAQLSLPAGEAPNVVFEIHSHYVDWSRGLERTEIVEFMRSLGYHVWAVRDSHSNVELAAQPIELIPVERVYLEGPPHGFNMLAVKDPRLVAGEPFRMRRDVSPKYLFHKDPSLYHPLKDRP